jgi:hypothetical protein
MHPMLTEARIAEIKDRLSGNIDLVAKWDIQQLIAEIERLKSINDKQEKVIRDYEQAECKW